MPPSWDTDSERHLLLLVISECDVHPANAIFEKVALRLGSGKSTSAVSQKYYKLKREYEATSPLGDDSAANAAPATPTASAKKGNAVKSVGKGKRKQTLSDETAHNGDEDVETPSAKRSKKQVKPGKKRIKNTAKEANTGDQSDLAEDTAGDSDEALAD